MTVEKDTGAFKINGTNKMSIKKDINRFGGFNFAG
jgi:hypothetical protein